MKQKIERLSRQKAGEAVVSVIVKQAMLAGATLEQLERETGRDRDELQRLLEQLERIEEIARGIRAVND